MTVRRSNIAAVVAILAGGCSPAWVKGPSPPLIRSVSSIAFTELDSAKAAEINNAAQIEAILKSWAFSPDWIAEDTRRIPVYRIDLHTDAGTWTYWLGTNSNPPRFPCYSLCRRR